MSSYCATRTHEDSCRPDKLIKIACLDRVHLETKTKAYRVAGRAIVCFYVALTDICLSRLIWNEKLLLFCIYLVNLGKKPVITVKANCFCPPADRVDHERIRDVGPDRAASEWLLRCGAMVRYQGQERWQKDYNHLPTGPLDKYKIQAIDATDSCIMNIGFDHMGNCLSFAYGKCCGSQWHFVTVDVRLWSWVCPSCPFSTIQLVSFCAWYLFLN